MKIILWGVVGLLLAASIALIAALYHIVCGINIFFNC